jgi:hypothetical protein
MPTHDLGDGDVDDGRRPGVGEVLRGCPHQRAVGRALERLDRRAQPASAEQRAASGAQRRDDGQMPEIVVVVGAREPEEPESVHGTQI